MIDTVEDFYNQVIKKLYSNNLFLKQKKNFYYKDILSYFNNFRKYILLQNKKKLRIATISKKSFSLYSSIISILLSQNTWIPLDDDLPVNVIKFILKDSKTNLALVDSESERKFGFLFNKLKIKYKNIDNFVHKKKRHENYFSFNKDFKFSKKNLAMIFYTSGSTGMPKGVKISNENFTSSLNGQIKHIFSYLNAKKLIFGDYHNTSFVISLNILLPCIYLGAEISPAISLKDRLFPLDHIKKNKVNCIVTLPSTISRLRLSGIKKSDIKLNGLLICGETFYYDTLKFIISKIAPKHLFNCYGSTELSPWVFSYKFNPKDLNNIKKIGLVPIGQNFFNTKIRIHKKLLLVSGPMVNTYLQKKDNLQNHLKINQKYYYCTNDIIKKYNELYYVMGRSDSVVKIRGYRIELKGIETRIREFKNVTNTFVFVNGKKIIAAIETNKKNQEIFKNKIREHLVYNLPNYMIPNEFIIYLKFPLNKSYKVNRYLIKKSYNLKL